MKNYKRFIGWILLISMFVGTLTNTVYAQINETIYEQDEALVHAYVERVNGEEWVNLPELFCAEQETTLSAILSEENNRTNNVGIYNVTYIHDYEMYEIEDLEMSIPIIAM